MEHKDAVPLCDRREGDPFHEAKERFELNYKIFPNANTRVRAREGRRRGRGRGSRRWRGKCLLCADERSRCVDTVAVP
jgi:hypothetical protein